MAASPKTDETVQTPTLLTACHARDLERLRLQRASIEACGVALPHVLVVDHEDVSRFRDLPNMNAVTVVSTRDVLSADTEARRRGYRLRRRQPEWWWCRRHGRPVHGWGIQQVIKLAAPRALGTDAYVCIDTDTFFVDPVSGRDFLSPDGRPLLYETGADDLDAEMAAWPAASMRFLGVKATGRPLHRYTHSPVVMSRDLVIAMQAHIERTHGRSWERAFLDAGVTEYTTYGVFAREVDGLRGVAPAVPALSCYFWWREQVEQIRQTFAARVTAERAKIVCVQSNVGCPIDDIRALAEPLWPRPAAEVAA